MPPFPQVGLLGNRYVLLPFSKADADALAGLAGNAVDGIMATGLSGPQDLGALAARLAVAEAETDRPDGAIRIAAVIDCARAAIALAGFAAPAKRLVALGIDARTLALDLGLPPDNHTAAPIATARGMCILAAKAAGLPCFELLIQKAVTAERVRLSRTDGFTTVAHHPTAD